MEGSTAPFRKKGLASLRLSLAVAFLALLAFPGASWAQRSSAAINGTVRDSTGAVVPQAIITLTNTQTNVTQTATTNDTGEYVILEIPPRYLRLEGFQGGLSNGHPAWSNS